MRKWQQIFSWGLLGLIGLGGCDRATPETPEAGDTMTDKPATVTVEKAEKPPLIVETEQQAAPPEAESSAKPATDLFGVEKVVFKFHKETKAEVCGDGDYFAYNGSMSIRGRIQTQAPIDMTADDFELDLTTPFESYTLPAQRKRETLSGPDRIEQVIVRKRKESIFYVKNYRVDDDETVYRNDDDETGVLKNYGPLIDAVFDWENQKFVISITRAELTAEDLEPGEIFEFSLTMPRFFSVNEDFDRTAEFRYTGNPIHSENYEYTGDCP